MLQALQAKSGHVVIRNKATIRRQGGRLHASEKEVHCAEVRNGADCASIVPICSLCPTESDLGILLVYYDDSIIEQPQYAHRLYTEIAPRSIR